uniref:Uncharacterized protein n=1 Tax=Kryptolebias marmoratus TaxID=37003 RepID=A0A3Q3AA49_KRYMA
MKFEEILYEVGGFCKFQSLLLLILCLPRAILPLHFLLHNFISATPPHRCSFGSPEERNGSSWTFHPDVLVLRIPRQDDGSFSSCRVYDSSLTSNFSQTNRTVLCPHGWIYDQSQFTSTTASEVIFYQIKPFQSKLFCSKKRKQWRLERNYTKTEEL